ncbi:hypothetical protein F0U44_00890 [Nocardioides humilatus]|uniref:Tat pathway signal sequence domain protein n=1 Tax=Nocardioides humilatus TaxID=2607660 RepID=A0A5B1LKD4_9ACTN|nr:hypothetical protein [Nocardioides humilatus]KAA1420934.1 hypothetical protein F0U44_00890 [Nocardioides humilatus]
MNLQLTSTLRRSSTAAIAVLAAAAGLVATPSPAEAKAYTSMTVTCSPSIKEGQTGICAFNVTSSIGVAPTGVVKVSAPKGELTPEECTLQQITTDESTCQVAYTPKGNGSDTRQDKVTGKYKGDDLHAPPSYRPSTSTSISVTPRREASLVGLSCGDAITAGGEGICSIVMDSESFEVPTPSGTVQFKTSRQVGLVESECYLFPSFPGVVACSVGYSPVGGGSPGRRDKITATYLGDENYRPFKASVRVRVPKNSDG